MKKERESTFLYLEAKRQKLCLTVRLFRLGLALQEGQKAKRAMMLSSPKRKGVWSGAAKLGVRSGKRN